MSICMMINYPIVYTGGKEDVSILSKDLIQEFNLQWNLFMSKGDENPSQL